VSTPSNPQPDNEFDFPVESTPPPRKKSPHHEQDNILLDIAEEVVDPIVERVGLRGCGCVWRLVTLPFRFVLWVIEEVLD
jgi:hypothetical protein